MDGDDFGADYYSDDCGRPYGRDDHWLGFFARIADTIVTTIRPARVLDAGCAMGLLVEALCERGVDAYGLDVSSYALSRVPPHLRDRCWRASLTDELSGAYDLIVCQEVLAHLCLTGAEQGIANLCRHSNDVLFSNAAYPPAPRHFNTAPPDHWAMIFASHGFIRDFAFDASVITPWAVRFRRRDVALPELVRQYEEQLHALRTDRDAAAASIEVLSGERDSLAAMATTADARIAAMEQSPFWKARRLVKQLTGHRD